VRRPYKLGLFVALALVTALLPLAAAEPHGGRATPARAPRKPPAKDAGAPPTSEPEAGVEAPIAAPKGPDAGTQGAVLETKTLDGGTRVFRFGEVEIEGRLRTPQIVYFLRRVRAEFAAGDLGHRTFQRELTETRKDPNF
jgi:hypothetical protein